MIQDFFDALAKGTEELQKKFCDLIDSRDKLKVENELLKHTLEQQTKQYEITYRELKEVVNERDKLKVNNDNLQLAFDVSKHVIDEYIRENAALKVNNDNLQLAFEYLKSENRSLQKEKDDGFSIDALKAKALIHKNKSFEEALKEAVAQRDINFRKAEDRADVINQRNSMIAGLQKQIRELEGVKDTQRMYAGIPPWSIPPLNLGTEFFDIRWQLETRIQGIEGKAIHLGPYAINFKVDSRIPAGTIIIK